MDASSFSIILRKQSRHINSLQNQINVLKKEIRFLLENREWSVRELANYDWQDFMPKQPQSVSLCGKK
jgi:hypothetical protein